MTLSITVVHRPRIPNIIESGQKDVNWVPKLIAKSNTCLHAIDQTDLVQIDMWINCQALFWFTSPKIMCIENFPWQEFVPIHLFGNYAPDIDSNFQTCTCE